jgi:hypothetical protein
MDKESFMKLCEARWEEMEGLSSRTNLYDLEKDFSEIWQSLGRSVLEERVGKVPKNKRKKKTLVVRLGR